MAELKTEVKVYHVDYICDKCDNGEMRYTGICLTSNPPQYRHICDKCQDVQNLSNAYPTTRTEP